eukprot:1138404-Pelagomonas_calceolata.AAC.1
MLLCKGYHISYLAPAICQLPWCPKLKLAGQKDGPDSVLDWFLDPSYYMFIKCECDEGWPVP